MSVVPAVTKPGAVDLAKIIPERIGLNMQSLQHAKTWTALLGGVTAGILGLTSLWGLLFFFLGSIVATMLTLNTPNAGFDSCFPGSKGSLFSVSALCTGLFTYILVWTMVYDGIYIF